MCQLVIDKMLNKIPRDEDLFNKLYFKQLQEYNDNFIKNVENFEDEIDNGLMGIYAITNRVTEKPRRYVGRSINLRGRKNSHYAALIRNRHKNIELQKDVNKYGIENFGFNILEICLNRDELKEKEVYYVDKYDAYYMNNNECGYNLWI